MTLDCITWTLGNGLRVALHRDPSLPVVCINIAYHVGSKDEAAGRTGFAHLFEHLMFDGSANVPRGEFDRHCELAGGYSNAYTVEDKTNYYLVLPSNQLALGLWLESDRLLSLSLTPDGLETQRSVVMEEKRQRVDNQPYGTWDERMTSMLFGGHPYGHTVIGSMDDIAAATMEDVVAFHRAFYHPGNAALSIAGDIDIDRTRDLVESYFGGIPAGVRPATTLPAAWPAPPGASVTVPDHVPLPAVFRAWRIPSERDASFPAVDLLSDVLGHGDSSRLHHSLVYDRQIASQASAWVDAREGDGMLIVYAIANPGRAVDELESALDEELHRLRAEGLSPTEMEKTRNRMESSYYLHLQTMHARADRLSHFALLHGDAAAAAGLLDTYLAVGSDDIAAAAARTLDPASAATIRFVPVDGEEAPDHPHTSEQS